MKCIIRKGLKGDCKGVLTLIHELARYEKASKEVEITVEDLISDGFGENSAFDMFVAIVDNVIVGTAIYYTRYSTWKGRTVYLEDLVVAEQYRGESIGSQLFEQVIEEAKQRKVKRMEWQILDWNEPALAFYKKYNAHYDDEWINGKLVYDQIQKF